MTPVTLISSFTNGNRRRRQVCGVLVGTTPDYWVVREKSARLNQVLNRCDWERES